MKREEIFNKLELIWEECQERNIGSNESELDFRESVANWIDKNFIEDNKCEKQTKVVGYYIQK